MRRPLAVVAATAVCTAVAVAPPVAALPAAAPCSGAPLRAAGSWRPPLDRPLSVTLDGLPLRDALDRVGRLAGLRLTYVADLLPLDQRVCLSAERAPAGQLLAALLEGTPLTPVAAGDDQVVLAPATDEARRVARESVRIGQLARVVVTGTRGAADRPTPSTIATDVIHGRDLEARGATTLAAALDGLVPGFWMWTPTPSAATARLGALRGASSFGAAAPKVYIDGIEVANPLVLVQLRPEQVEQVEVIRGPQGGALFGADAIGGVVQITTRHSPTGVDAPRAQVSATTGIAAADGAPRGIPVRDQALTLRFGGLTRSGGLQLASATVGDYVPRAASAQWSAGGDLRLVGRRRSLVAQGRVSSLDANHPTTPLAATNRAGITTYDANIAPQSVQQYSIGTAATTVTTDGWTSRLTVGLDGYRLRDPITDPARLGSATDSALRAAAGAADRLTLRASTSRTTTLPRDGAATLTLTADHSTLREATLPATQTARGDALLRHTTAAIARADLTWGHHVQLAAGARLEQNRGFSPLPQLSLLPTISASSTRQIGSIEATLRAAYGQAIRPPRVPALLMGGTRAMRLVVDAALAPERQSGTELGLDLSLGPRLTLGLTRFDQRATGLLQASTVTAELAPWRGPATRRLMTAVQNVGEIANHGWEATATSTLGALTLTGTLGTVRSTVARVSPGYLGDLQPGDRMLEIPAYTTGLSARWTRPTWSTSLTIARAGHWIGYDRAAMAADLASGRRLPEQLAGGSLRDYWREYDAISRVRFAMSRNLGRRLTLTLAGDNLLDVRRGEPDNLTVLPGRTLSAGLRARL